MLRRQRPALGPRAAVEYRPLADGGMVYDPDTQQIHHLNATAALIWEECGRNRSAAEIAETLCLRFAVEPTRAAADVEQVLDEFGRQGLLAE